jgi:endonuclease-3
MGNLNTIISLLSLSSLPARNLSTSTPKSSPKSSSSVLVSSSTIRKLSMTISESKVNGIMKVLDSYFPEPPVPLNSNDPFTFLCSVILSAQTTDGKVNEVTKVLWANGGGDPYKLKDFPVDKVQSMIQPVGLAPAKAKYLVGSAKMIVEEFNGQIPNSLEELTKLPGVGKKTASVVLSQVYGVPAFAVDTHVHRLANRWGLSKHTDVNKVQADLMEIFPQEHWNKLHLQFIYFGRQFCTAKDHGFSECPMCSWVNKAGAATQKLPTQS